MKKMLSLALLFPAVAFANPINENCPQHVIHGAPISSITENTQYICHGNYAIHYRYDVKVAEFVVEHLDEADITGPAKRKDDFRTDPLVDDDKEAHPEDYAGSGYDRGHLVPAADNRADQEQMSESFYLTNMMPQDPGNNRVIWRIMEKGVRNTAAAGNDIYVVSGTIFDEGFKTIGNGVGVPTRVWKVVYNRTNGETLAFLLPNQKYSSKEIPNFTVTVNDVEEATGINFFPELDEESEEKVVLAAWPEIFK